MALWVDSASNGNEYQGRFLVGKGGRCVRLTTLPPSCVVVTKSGKRNLLEPSGPLQACNGTGLPLPLRILVLGKKWEIKGVILKTVAGGMTSLPDRAV